MICFAKKAIIDPKIYYIVFFVGGEFVLLEMYFTFAFRILESIECGSPK